LVDFVKAKVQPRGRKPGGDAKKRKMVLPRLRRVAPAAQTSHRARHIETRKTAILDAALQTFSRYGLHGATVEQIAEAAEVSKTNLFYYFPSKDEVYIAVLERLLADWLDPLQMLEVDSNPVEAIGSYIRRKIEFSRSSPEASRLFCLEIVQGAPLVGRVLRTSLKKLVDEKAGVINAWVGAGKLAPIDPYHLIFSIWSITQHYADFAAQIEAITGLGLDDDAFFEETVKSVQTLVLGGLTRGLAGSRAHPERRRVKQESVVPIGAKKA
jgi:TetR/AcrR family transcriptional regulator